ncbi:hypothetical protein ACPVTF_08655 [Geobacillus icigianus]|nr:hypothetical protein [Geobacillus sp. B4113_201601]KYD25452.1 hypothetical protein B4113_1684 [Geobacillus sp. B4113_201601]
MGDWFFKELLSTFFEEVLRLLIRLELDVDKKQQIRSIGEKLQETK